MTMGQAIFSKHPIINSGLIGDSSRSIPSIYADIVKGEDTVRIYNFHLESIRFQKDEYSLFDNSISSDKDYRSEDHTSELQSRPHLVCRLLLEKKKKKKKQY